MRTILFISIIGISVSSYLIISTKYSYKKAEQKYDEIVSVYEKSEFDHLQQINQDYLGWIKVEGTNINYPVVQGVDNDFYLTHNFHKEPDKVGSIYMDYRNSNNELDKNVIIYGHNMKDQSMFATLRHFLDEEFFNENKTITLEFSDNEYEWEVFSAYVTRETDWMEVDFNEPSNFLDFAGNMSNKSYNSSSSDINENDQIITLATCTSHVDDERVVVHGKLIKEN
ncbi:MAG TPA: class B sortase [Bacteroidales bacterium]|nr:class B sortase [Bacteroidales bacterium]